MVHIEMYSNSVEFSTSCTTNGPSAQWEIVFYFWPLVISWTHFPSDVIACHLLSSPQIPLINPQNITLKRRYWFYSCCENSPFPRIETYFFEAEFTYWTNMHMHQNKEWLWMIFKELKLRGQHIHRIHARWITHWETEIMSE